MKKLFLCALMLLSTSVFATTLEGRQCGRVDVRYEQDNVTVTCSDAVVPPIPEPTPVPNPTPTPAPITPIEPAPVTPSPVSCPQGVDCTKTLPWPVNPQQLLRHAGNSELAYKVALTGSAKTGKLATAYTSGDSANREITLSLKPGDFTPASKYCKVSGTQSTTLFWSQGPSSLPYDCELPLNGTAYVNIRHTSCPAATRCEFIIRNY